MMKSIRKELARYPGKKVLPLTEPRLKPFDVEATFAEVALARKEHTRKYHGPDSLLYSAIYPVVCIMKVFGLAPYDFTGDEITPSNACLLFSFAFIGVYCHIIYIVYKRFLGIRRDKAILSVVETTKVTVNYLVAMYDIISTIFTRKRFSRIWNAQQDFDERLSQLGYPRKETKVKIAIWILLASQIVTWTAVNQSGMFAFEETWTFNVSYMCPYIGTATAVYKFFGMVSFLGLRFHQLNQIAKENLPPKVGYKSSNISRQTIQDLHNDLMLSSETLGSLYSWSLLFWLGNLSIHSVSNLYFIIDWVILTPWTNIAWPLIFNMWCWLIGFITQLLALHIACDYTINEANFMSAILIEWEARTLQKFPYEDSFRTSLYSLNRRLCFSAAGLFDIKLSLLCSIVKVMSNYLIILLQFPSS
ncbi:putative gustatory receptor 2a [Apis florea]|uniref:putative gustatory receptor 2a n=1 Tax=Apis florea TaxID=7463 RepID=UPI0006293581|nr:putative gustatory receptor 2a [Apis florea]